MDNEKKFDNQKKALEKIYNRMVPKRYPFIDSIDVISIDDDGGYIGYTTIKLSVTISGEYLEDCKDFDIVQTLERINQRPEHYFRFCQDNPFLSEGFLSYLVSLGKLLITEDFVIIALGASWYSDGDLRDDNGKTL
jgi:hypothetical protein